MSRFVLLVILCACAAPPKGDPADAEADAGDVARLALAAAADAEAHPDDAARQTAAASDCAIAASVVVLRFQAANLAAAGTPAMDVVLDAENRLDAAQRDQVRAVAEAGIAAARRAIALAPDDVEGHFALAVSLAMSGLTKSTAAALFEGLAGDIRDAADDALALDRNYRDGAPVGFKGRFCAAAPWPVRDLKAAGPLLEEAVHLGPFAMHWLFLGDLRWRQGRHDDARRAWERAATAPIHPTLVAAEPAIRAMVRFRLAN